MLVNRNCPGRDDPASTLVLADVFPMGRVAGTARH